MSHDAATSPENVETNGHEDHILAPGHTFTTVSDKISAIVLTRPYGRRWLVGMAISFLLINALFLSLAYLLSTGVGIWGIKTPVMWGFAIVNFVWWIGIGHAGTLISAILLLLKQEWRTSINRFAEAMTLFAVSCAGLFPLIHMGRWWLCYWLLPYPNTMAMWPQWRSPLVWDAFAVSTYATVSLLFWYIGLIPDVATLRDRAKNRVLKYVYGFMSMGWRGSARHWHRYHTTYLLMAALATPLVVSVHTIVSWDFAVAIMPGWHSTIFPPYFVAGAIYSGFAMVLTLAIPLRKYYGLTDFITDKHLDNMAKVLLATGMIVTYGYATEAFMAWYGENKYDRFMILQERPFGYYWHTYWMLIATNCVTVQCMWIPACRRNPALLWTVSIIVNVGMWLERYVIIVTSLSKDYLPSSWNEYHGTFWDYLTYYGTIGLFGSLIFLFIRFLPAISIAEMRELVQETREPSGGVEPLAKEANSPMSHHEPVPTLYGMLAEFETPEAVLAAARAAQKDGYTRMDAYSPLPVEGLAEAVNFTQNKIPMVVFIGGILGGSCGYFMQWYATSVHYPINIGGRPFHSWPMFLPITFELTVLFSAFAAVFGMLGLNGLPRPHHPVFGAKGFERASRDRFFLSIQAVDPKFDAEVTKRFLEGLSPIRVQAVDL